MAIVNRKNYFSYWTIINQKRIKLKNRFSMYLCCYRTKKKYVKNLITYYKNIRITLHYCCNGHSIWRSTFTIFSSILGAWLVNIFVIRPTCFNHLWWFKQTAVAYRQMFYYYVDTRSRSLSRWYLLYHSRLLERAAKSNEIMALVV